MCDLPSCLFCGDPAAGVGLVFGGVVDGAAERHLDPVRLPGNALEVPPEGVGGHVGARLAGEGAGDVVPVPVFIKLLDGVVRHADLVADVGADGLESNTDPTATRGRQRSAVAGKVVTCTGCCFLCYCIGEYTGTKKGKNQNNTHCFCHR